MFFGETVDLLNDRNVLLQRFKELVEGEFPHDLEEFLVEKKITLEASGGVIVLNLLKGVHF